jgi:gamma-glutamylcysteine synthetase
MSDKPPEEKKEAPKVYPVSPPVNVPDEPVMTMSQFQQGAQMMQRFLKGIEIKVKGNKVQTIYNWEFPDEVVARTFAESMKEQFEGAMEEASK